MSSARVVKKNCKDVVEGLVDKLEEAEQIVDAAALARSARGPVLGAARAAALALRRRSRGRGGRGGAVARVAPRAGPRARVGPTIPDEEEEEEEEEDARQRRR